MTARREQGPKGNQPDEFDLIAGELVDQLNDPYVLNTHTVAKAYEELLSSEHNSDETMAGELIKDLDKLWGHNGQTIRITGTAWQRQGDKATKRVLVDEAVVSCGFTFIRGTGHKGDAEFKVGHLIAIKEHGDAQPRSVMYLDDVLHIELPEPSTEMRRSRFAYHHETQAGWIDELAYTSVRDDQVILSMREFYVDFNLDDSDEKEALVDADEYIRATINHEKKANYKMSIEGDIILIDSEGNGYPSYLSSAQECILAINDVYLRPADITLTEAIGRQRCVVYVDATIFKDGDDVDALIPCTSILWMNNVRYDQPA